MAVPCSILILAFSFTIIVPVAILVSQPVCKGSVSILKVNKRVVVIEGVQLIRRILVKGLATGVPKVTELLSG